MKNGLDAIMILLIRIRTVGGLEYGLRVEMLVVSMINGNMVIGHGQA